jgi:predicted amidohydrolase YtcJ
LTDTSPGNGAEELGFMSAMHQRGDLPQDVLAMGNASLDRFAEIPGVTPGPRKIHLREAALPDFSEACADIARSHAARRPVAIHCVTLAELVFALGAITEAGALPGDRIEHAAVAPPDTLPLIVKLGLTVVTQPNFIAERGDAYLRDVDPADIPWLCRLRGFRDAGISLAGGTDAPFGDADPWKAMAAAVSRRSASGILMGADEAVTPEEALGLFTTEPLNPGGSVRSIRVGLPADLCLIDRPWSAARSDLAKVGVAMTLKEGQPAKDGQPV